MKKIALIDIYEAKITDNLEVDGELKYDLYAFNQTTHGYELSEKIENPQPESFKGISEFYLSLPVALLNFRILELPFNDREKLLKVIPFELNDLVIGGSGNIIYDFITLSISENNNKIFVTYIEKKTLFYILKKIQSIGIDPPIITSIELGKIIREKKEDIAPKLIAFEPISEEERIKSAIEEIVSPLLNLRTGEFTYTKDKETYLKKVKLTLILLILLAFLVNAILGLRIFIAKDEISSIKKDMRSVYSSLFPADKKITDELYQMKSHMKNIKDKADILIGINTLEHMVKLSDKRSKGVVVEELSIEKDMITIKGEAGSMGDLDELKKNLSDKYQNVSISDMKPLSENKILFTLIIKEKLL